MTTERKLHIGAWLAALVLCACFARTWVEAREQRIRADAQDTATRQVLAAKDAAIASRDRAASEYVTQMAAQAAAVHTPQQAAQVILRYLPTPTAPPGQPAAPAPTAPVVVSKAELPADVQKQLPDAPSYDILTGAQAEAVARTELACDAAGHSLAACQADNADLRTELAAREADTAAWKRAAKGGSRWQRFGRVLRAVGCAGAGAAIGSVANHTATATAAAVGAGAGVAACAALP